MLFTVYIYRAQHYIAIRDTRKVYLFDRGGLNRVKVHLQAYLLG